jgi:YggT family protein
MSTAVFFVVQTLFELYMLCFLLRLVLQLTRADFHNPLSQFIVRVTSPIVTPLRRIIPPIRGLDTATLLVFLAFETLAVWILAKTAGITLPIAALVYLVPLRALYTVIRMYVFAILIYAILSFVSPGTYNPISSVLASICEPLLRPVRRIIPAIGGLDLSPLFVLIGLQALMIGLPMQAWLA